MRVEMREYYKLENPNGTRGIPIKSQTLEGIRSEIDEHNDWCKIAGYATEQFVITHCEVLEHFDSENIFSSRNVVEQRIEIYPA